MAVIDLILIYALAFLFFVLLALFFHNKKKENIQKKLALLFDEAKKDKKLKSPHLILGIFVIFARVLAKVLSGFYKKMTRSISLETSARTEVRLQLANYPFLLDAHGWHWLKITSALIFFLVMFMISAGNEQWNYMVYAVLLTALGYYYPDYFLNTLLQKRKNKISRELPDAMDFLSLCLAAGMNFQLAVEEYIKRNETLLAEEFSIFINQLDVGVQRIEAFQLLLERNESSEMKNFLSSIIQSERLGTSLRPVIASQAEDLREKRKQFVEKLIAQAPVKMLFPMMFFIMPAMLIITLSSVLLPGASTSSAYTLSEQNFLYISVTPGIQAIVNQRSYPIYHIHKEEEGREFTLVPSSPQAMVNEEQRQYMLEYFQRNRTLTESSFIRIDLPYDQRLRLNIELRSNDGQMYRIRRSIKVIKFELDNFEAGRKHTPSSRLAFKGFATPEHTLSLSLNRVPLEVRIDEDNPERFVSSMANLRHGRNVLSVKITDQYDGELEKDYMVFYDGIAVTAQFREREETLKDTAFLQGQATPGTTLHIMRVIEGRSRPEVELEMEDEGLFAITIPLQVGDNIFRIFLRQDNDQSPVITRMIVRKMTAEE